jgi:TRAP-type C4-dicarboxylate transport system permease small subunit
MHRGITGIFSQMDQWFDKGGTFLIVLGGSLIASTVFLQVLLRYVFKHPLFGIEEFSRLVAVWVYFIGAVFGTREESHVFGDVARMVFKTPHAKAILRFLASFFSLITCIIFTVYSYNYTIWLYQTGERTTGLWWPRVISVSSMLFGAVFMTAYCLSKTISYSISFFRIKEQAEG